MCFYTHLVPVGWALRDSSRDPSFGVFRKGTQAPNSPPVSCNRSGNCQCPDAGQNCSNTWNEVYFSETVIFFRSVSIPPSFWTHALAGPQKEAQNASAHNSFKGANKSKNPWICTLLPTHPLTRDPPLPARNQRLPFPPQPEREAGLKPSSPHSDHPSGPRLSSGHPLPLALFPHTSASPPCLRGPFTPCLTPQFPLSLPVRGGQGEPRLGGRGRCPPAPHSTGERRWGGSARPNGCHRLRRGPTQVAATPSTGRAGLRRGGSGHGGLRDRVDVQGAAASR